MKKKYNPINIKNFEVEVHKYTFNSQLIRYYLEKEKESYPTNFCLKLYRYS